MSARREIEVPGYQARAIFVPYHHRNHDRNIRFSIGVAHRRAGKTLAHIGELVGNAGLIRREPPPVRCAYLAPTYRQAKDIAWQYLKALTPHGAAHETELRIDFDNGARIRLYGADNAHRLRGLYFDHVVLDEYGLMSPSVWPEIIRPTLSDYTGKASFIGTPNGRNHFWELYDKAGGDPESWFRFELRASQTGVLPKAELDAARKDMTPEQYDQEYECSFQAGVIGAYYGREMAQAESEGRIAAVPWQPQFPVETAWDLGIGDSTAIWFAQRAGKELHVIDYLENAGVGLDWYAARLKERPYAYEIALLPHDAAPRELGSGKSIAETLTSLGIRNRVLPAERVEQGINAARLLFPQCWFDAAKCKRGLEALRQYRAEYDDKRKAFNERPLHDWTSHAADAFRYLAMGLRAHVTRPKAPREYAASWMG